MEGLASPKALLSGKVSPTLTKLCNQEDTGLVYLFTSGQTFNYIFSQRSSQGKAGIRKAKCPSSPECSDRGHCEEQIQKQIKPSAKYMELNFLGKFYVSPHQGLKKR